MTANNPMTGEQLDELMTVAVNMQRDSEKSGNRPSAMFAYAVQVAVLELRKVRDDAAKMPETSMSITRYWISPNGIACEDESGSFVKYEDYAALEARCAALAAELQSVKAMNDCLSEELRGYESDGAFEGPKMHLLWWQCETPNLDAFLAEVRAQGVDMFALMFAEEAIKTNNITTGWRAKASRAASEYAEALRENAAQLRKGVQS